MRVEKRFVAIGKTGVIFLSKVVGVPTEKGSGWNLQIQRQMNGGGFEVVHDVDYGSLWHAKRGMEKWRKGLKWMPQN